MRIIAFYNTVFKKREDFYFQSLSLPAVVVLAVSPSGLTCMNEHQGSNIQHHPIKSGIVTIQQISNNIHLLVLQQRSKLMG